MVEIEASIRTQLLTKSAVTAIVGSGSSARIRPYTLDQDDDIRTGPGIVIKVNNESEEDTTDLECTSGLVQADVSILCIAQTSAEAKALARAVKNNGTKPGTGLSHSEWNIEGIREVQSCCYTNTMHGFVSYTDDSDEGFYFADAHYLIQYDETI